MMMMIRGETSPVLVPRADVLALIDLVARDWGSCLDEVTGLGREELVVTARIAAICACYQRFPALSLRQIGNVFNRSKVWVYWAVAETIGVRGDQV